MWCVQRIGGGRSADQEAEDPEVAQVQSLSPLKAALSSVQTLALAAICFVCADKLEGILAAQPVPEQVLAQNAALTLRTCFAGVVYLAAFMFGANGIGIGALAVKLAIWGDDDEIVKPVEKGEEPQLPPLPHIDLRGDLDDILRAMDEVADVSRYRTKKEPQDAAKK
jgi:Protein of unknown function (DUF3082)